MTKPQRIQLSRKRGFRLQEASLALNGLPAVKVDRTTQWGNPWTAANSGAVDPVLRFACETAPLMELSSLRGKNLACWCRIGAECHADVLLAMANETPNPDDTPQEPPCAISSSSPAPS